MTVFDCITPKSATLVGGGLIFVIQVIYVDIVVMRMTFQLRMSCSEPVEAFGDLSTFVKEPPW